MNQDIQYCAQQLRALDFDRYALALLAPTHLRDDFFVLLTFYRELAKIADGASEPLTAQIRLQWWRDLVDGNPHGDASSNPLANAVSKVAERKNGLQRALHELIDAREQTVSDDPPESFEALGQAADANAGTLYATLGILCTNASQDPASFMTFTRLLARAENLVGLVRNIGFDASRGRVGLPLELMRKHEFDPHSLLKGETTPVLRDAVREILAQAMEMTVRLADQKPQLSKELTPAIRTSALLKPRIELLTDGRLDVAAPPKDLSHLSILWRMWRV